MKIAWHMPRLRRTCCGLSIRALRLADGLRQHGHEITFFVAREKTESQGDSIEGFALRRIGAPSQRPMHWSLQSQARRRSAAMMASQIDIDHDLMISCQPEFVDAYRRRHCDRPLVFICGGTTLLHDEADRQRARIQSRSGQAFAAVDRMLKHRNEKAGFRRADAVVFDSDATRKLAIREYALEAEKCHTIHGGVHADDFSPPSESDRKAARRQLELADAARIVVWTGRLSPEKNLGLLLQALRLCQTKPDLVLIVGDGPSRDELLSLRDRLGLASYVAFSGERADVRPFLHAADLFVFPSRGESFGGALVEAMACGLACIALRPDGAAIRTASLEIIEHDKSGWLVEGSDAPALAHAIDRLMADHGKRVLLGQAAQRRAESRFSWRHAATKLNELLFEIVSPKAPGKPASGFRLVETALGR